MRSKMTDEEQIESLVRQFGDAVDADAWENLKERLTEKKCPREACANLSKNKKEIG